MPTTSRFDDARTIEFLGGPWCGMKYTPRIGEHYPATMHMTWGGRLYRYDLRIVGAVYRFEHVGSALPDGAEIK